MRYRSRSGKAGSDISQRYVPIAQLRHHSRPTSQFRHAPLTIKDYSLSFSGGLTLKNVVSTRPAGTPVDERSVCGDVIGPSCKRNPSCSLSAVWVESDRPGFWGFLHGAYMKAEKQKAQSADWAKCLYCLGWMMGLEPTTTGITILDSTN